MRGETKRIMSSAIYRSCGAVCGGWGCGGVCPPPPPPVICNFTTPKPSSKTRIDMCLNFLHKTPLRNDLNLSRMEDLQHPTTLSTHFFTYSHHFVHMILAKLACQSLEEQSWHLFLIFFIFCKSLYTIIVLQKVIAYIIRKGFGPF